jgi:hypothetical protein
MVVRAAQLFVLWRDFRLDVHIAQFSRFEDLAAFHALNVFRVFISRDNLDMGMPTRLVHGFTRREVWSSVGWLAEIHNVRPNQKGLSFPVF